MAGEPVIGDGARPVSSTPSTPASALKLPAELLRSLTEVLAEGEVVSARVVQVLGGDQYQLALRGRTIVAQSAVPLTQDSVVRIQLVAGGAQPTLRLLGLSALFDQTWASGTPARVQALGLPPTPGALAAVAAFEEVGAPLDPARLRHAVDQSAPLPPAEAATRLRALALVARADLPATPALIALAGHAVTQGGERALPNPAAAVIALRQAAQPLLPSAAESAAAGTAPLETDLPTTVTAPAVVSAQATTADPRKLWINQPPLTSAQPATPTASVTAAMLATGVPATAVPSAAVSAATVVPADVDGTTLAQAPSTHIGQAPVATAAQSAPTGQPALANLSPAADRPVPGNASAHVAVPVPVSATASPPVPLSASPSQPLSATSATLVVSQSQPPVIAPRPALPQSASPAVLLRDLFSEPLPDLATGGVEAAKRALSLAGVRARPEAGDEPAHDTRPTTLAQRVAALPQAEQADGTRTFQSLAEPAMRLTRELAAETVFKPKDLADYDHVVALPITVHGQPVPARFAVAERRTTGGNATFVRVDTELSALGEVSVRLSGVDGGALAITLLASGSGGRALADGLPDLVDALRQRGIVAGVRVADPLVDTPLADDHG